MNEVIKSSKAFKLLSFLDLNIEKSFNDSFFVQFFCGLIQGIRNFLNKIATNSNIFNFLVQKIDFIILFLISGLIILLSFGSTKAIGLVSLLVIAFSAFKLFTSNKIKDINSFDVPIALYVLIAGLSVCFSSLFLPSLKGYIKMLMYFGLYLSFANILWQKPKRILYLLIFISSITILESIFAVYQHFGGVMEISGWQDKTDVNPEQLLDRVYGTLKPFNPNLLAGFLVAGFGSILASICYFVKKKNILLSILFLLGALITLIAILFSGCRGAYLAVLAMGFGVVVISGHLIWNDFPNKKTWKKLWLLCIFALISAGILFIMTSPSLQHRIASIFAFRDDSSNSFRMNVYASSFKMFLDNPLIGIGTGNATYRLIYGLYMRTGF
ncbi:MAG: O-antigen ligase family protein, partial [Candidatus Gastranaerophilales bacterium]|nr:O-antigen ligase family protein [Candidatus Gastranaerophilales bacterium]